MNAIDEHLASLAQFNPKEERIEILYGTAWRVQKPSSFFRRFVEWLFGKPETLQLQTVVSFVNQLLQTTDFSVGTRQADLKSFVAKLTPKAHLKINGWPPSFYLSASPEIEQILDKYPVGKKQLLSGIIEAQDTQAFMAMQRFMQGRGIETCPARPIERPGRNWPFSSDHPPIGAVVDGIPIASWNLLNPEFDHWIAEDTQGLRGSGLDDRTPSSAVPGLTKREEENADRVIQMIQTGNLKVFHLQECRVAFLDHLRTKLPAEFELRKDGVSDNYNAIIVDTRRFQIMVQHTGYRCPSDRKKPWIALQLKDTQFNRTFNFFCVHGPGNPEGSGPEELAKSVAGSKSVAGLPKAGVTVVMGDMNFEELRIRSAFGPEALVLSPYATNTFKDGNSLTDFIEKCIDHVVVLGNVEAIPLPLNALHQKFQASDQ